MDQDLTAVVMALGAPGLIVLAVLVLTYVVKASTPLKAATEWLPLIAVTIGGGLGALLLPSEYTAKIVAMAVIQGMGLGLLSAGGKDLLAGGLEIFKKMMGNGSTVLLIFILPALLAGGCGPWINPDDPDSVELACGDVRAGMATVADVALTMEEADAACAVRIAEVFEAFAEAVRDNSPEAVAEALEKILGTVTNDQDYRLYQRLLRRAKERVAERLAYMAEAAEDEQAAGVAKLLTIAGLEGVAEGAREYAAGL